MKFLVVAGLLVYVSGTLCACGQKGPLVLPDAPKRKHTIPTMPAAPAPKGNGSTQGPAGSNPATSPPPPASPAAPAPSPTPPPR